MSQSKWPFEDEYWPIELSNELKSVYEENLKNVNSRILLCP